jgi:hypothetical protein
MRRSPSVALLASVIRGLAVSSHFHEARPSGRTKSSRRVQRQIVSKPAWSLARTAISIA